MTRITKLLLQNFKSVRHIEFEMKPLNILIGPNGAGKSNIINFFRLLPNAADENLARSIRAMGGLQEIRWRGASDQNVIAWEVEFDGMETVNPPGSQQRIYSVALASQGNGFVISHEEVSPKLWTEDKAPGSWLQVLDGQLKTMPSQALFTGGLDLIEYKINPTELAIAQLRDPIRYPVLNELRRTLADWTIFRGFGENALSNLYQAQPLEITQPLRLDPTGLNLVSVLHAFANDPKYATAQESLNDYLRVALPDFRKLDLPVVSSGMIELRWRSRNFSGRPSFPARSMSDGMLRFLGLATLLLLPDPPPLIAIDEPEIGLHPKLLPILAELLKNASQRTQIIVTTHSPQLLSADAIELDDVVLVDCPTGETTLERAATRTDLSLWLERYTLGNLWTMGKLESSPQ